MRVGTGICAAIGLVAAILAAPAGAKPGDVIVGDADAEQVLRLKPNGNISVISDDDRLDSPSDSVFGSNGKLYVVDYDAFDPAAAVFSINPKTGKTKVLAKEDPLIQPDGIALAPNGDLYVTDIEANALFRVELPGGDVELVSDDSDLAGSIGVVAPPDGDPFVEGADAIVQVDPISGDADPITDGDYGAGDGLTRSPDGTLYATDVSGSTLRSIDPVTGVDTLAAPEAFSQSYGLAFDFEGRVLVTDDNNVWAVDPAEDTNDLLSDDFGYAEGLEVEPPKCEGRTATIVGTEGDDTIDGSPFDDVMVGLGGEDTLAGSGGDDRICGGDGGDDIDGQGGRDRCDGGKGRDELTSC
jgi:sugar lactone lactonase YvrE